MTIRRRRRPTPNLGIPPPFNPMTGEHADLRSHGTYPYCAMMQVAAEDTYDDYVVCRGFDPRINRFVDYEEGNENKPGISVAKPFGRRLTGQYQVGEVYPALLPTQGTVDEGRLDTRNHVPPSPNEVPWRLGQNPGTTEDATGGGHPQSLDDEIVPMTDHNDKKVNWMLVDQPADLRIELKDDAPDLPSFGCCEFDQFNAYTEDIVDDVAGPALEFPRRGMRYINGQRYVTVDEVRAATPALQVVNHFQLLLNGPNSLTTESPRGVGFLAADTPRWGLLYDGFDPNNWSATWLSRTWGPYWLSGKEGQEYDLWPGVPGFLMVGGPERFTLDGDDRYKALFIRDPSREIVMVQNGSVWDVSPGPGDSVLTGRLVKTLVNDSADEVYDGSDATHPLIELTVGNPAVYPGGTKDFNIEDGEVFIAEILRTPEDGTGIGLTSIVAKRRFAQSGTQGNSAPLIDDAVGTIRWQTDATSNPRGWALADGSANSSGSGEDFTGIDANLLPYERLAN